MRRNVSQIRHPDDFEIFQTLLFIRHGGSGSTERNATSHSSRGRTAMQISGHTEQRAGPANLTTSWIVQHPAKKAQRRPEVEARAVDRWRVEYFYYRMSCWKSVTVTVTVSGKSYFQLEPQPDKVCREEGQWFDGQLEWRAERGSTRAEEKAKEWIEKFKQPRPSVFPGFLF